MEGTALRPKSGDESPLWSAVTLRPTLSAAALAPEPWKERHSARKAAMNRRTPKGHDTPLCGVPQIHSSDFVQADEAGE